MEKQKKKLKEGEEEMRISPKLTQDLKKRVFEIDGDGNTKVNPENDTAGNDPATGGHDPNVSNMAAQSVNKPAIGQAVGIKDVQPTEIQTQGHQPNETVSRLIDPDLGESKEPKEPAIDISKRITRSAVRRGRPRRRGLSLNPPVQTQSDDMMQVLLNIQDRMEKAQIEREKFNNDTLTSIDIKFQDVKDSLSASVVNIKSDIKDQADILKVLNVKSSDHDIRISDVEVRLEELENEILTGKGATDVLTAHINEHISKVEMSLATDIETVKGGIELQISEKRQYQLQLENRMGDMTTEIHNKING